MAWIDDPLGDIADMQRRFNEAHNLVAAHMEASAAPLNDRAVYCALCNLIVLESVLEHLELVHYWPEEIYEDVLDADEIDTL